MRTCLPFAIVFLTAFNAWAAEPAGHKAVESSSTTAIERKLERTIIPKVEFHEVSIEEALGFLRTKAVELDPKHKGVEIALRPDALSVVPESDSTTAGKVSRRDLRITMSLTEISLRETLKYTASLADLKIRIHPDSVELVPLSDPDPMITKEFRFNPKWLEKPRYPDGGKELRESFKQLSPKEALEKQGVVFPEGATVSFNKSKTRLIVHNAAENIDVVEATLGYLKDLYLLSMPPLGPPRLLSKPTWAEDRPMRNNLRKIVLPKVSFDNIQLREAVDELKALSRKYDTKKSDPSHRGVNIVISQGSGNLENSGESLPSLEQLNARLITFAGSRISLLEALEAVAKLAEMKLKIGQYAVIIVPTSDPEPLIVKEYFIHPVLFDMLIHQPAKKDDISEEEKKHAMDYLTASGVIFPQGPIMNWLPRSSRLIVRNTEENHAKVEKMLAAVWEEYKATHKKNSNKPKP